MDKIKTLLVVSLLLSGLYGRAEEAAQAVTPWNYSGVVGLNASATGLVNWAAGGVNSVSGVAFGKVRLLYDKTAISWESNLDVEYGMSYLEQKYDPLQKSSDHLVFNTKLGWAFRPKWYLTVQAGFQTQFDLGRKYTGDENVNPVISNILAPSYTDVSVGMDWKPNTIFSVYLSPVAGRITTAYVSDKLQERFNDQYAVADGGLRQNLQEKYGTWKYAKEGRCYEKRYTNAKASLGLSVKGNVNWSYKDLKILSSLTLFTPYAWDKTKLYLYNADQKTYSETEMIRSGYALNDAIYLGYRDNNQRFGNFDVDWNLAVSYQFLKCLNVTLSTDLKYYNGVKIEKNNEAKERVQFKSILGLGMGYSF